MWRPHRLFGDISEARATLFMFHVINEQEEFARLGKLLVASVWLQSQMAALICLHKDEELRRLGRLMPEKELAGC